MLSKVSMRRAMPVGYYTGPKRGAGWRLFARRQNRLGSRGGPQTERQAASRIARRQGSAHNDSDKSAHDHITEVMRAHDDPTRGDERGCDRVKQQRFRPQAPQRRGQCGGGRGMARGEGPMVGAKPDPAEFVSARGEEELRARPPDDDPQQIDDNSGP